MKSSEQVLVYLKKILKTKETIPAVAINNELKNHYRTLFETRKRMVRRLIKFIKDN